jgi:hypothetical protein
VGDLVLPAWASSDVDPFARPRCIAVFVRGCYELVPTTVHVLRGKKPAHPIVEPIALATRVREGANRPNGWK